MKVLIVGGGGREHALAWKAAQTEDVEIVHVAPGNAGTGREPRIRNVSAGVEDFRKLADFARSERVDLTIIGPEAPLVAGIVDVFTAEGLRCLGPSREAALLEGSKSFARDFLDRHRIPSPAHATFTAIDPAVRYIRERGAPVVIKADGLAAGKGVVIAATEEDAVAAVNDMLSGRKAGDAGRRIVIEEYLEGEEASFIVLTDGVHVLPLASSQDHKARDDGDRGPITGGMGACSPAPVVTPEIHGRILREVIEPVVHGMAAEGRKYTGFLYAGLMIGADGTPRVLEFNCRMGDPEAQPILLRLESDLVALCNAALDGTLDRVTAAWDDRPALGVVLASAGYPGNVCKGDVIAGLDAAFPAEIKVFHAGTQLQNDAVVTAGGRVLCVTGLGKSMAAAQSTVYEAVQKIFWNGMFCRRDIGYRAVRRVKDSEK